MPHDRGAVLLLPLPDLLDELLPAKLVAGDLFLGQFSLHDVLRGDAGMVGAGYPKRGIILHPFPAGQDVLDGVVERVAHVQDAGHVGRGTHDGERAVEGVQVRLEIPLLLPLLVEPGFNLRRRIR